MQSRQSSGTQGFPGSLRLKRSRQFLTLQRQGRKLYSKHFLLLVDQNGLSHSRLGVTITRKLDQRATVRNKLRRRIRELFRTQRPHIAPGFDILVIARKNAQEITYGDLRREIMGALRHAGFLKTARQA